MLAINIENLKKTKRILSTVYSKYGHEYDKIFEE